MTNIEIHEKYMENIHGSSQKFRSTHYFSKCRSRWALTDALERASERTVRSHADSPDLLVESPRTDGADAAHVQIPPAHATTHREGWEAADVSFVCLYC